ncbi:hypothetical protein A3H22_02640 [Candidatus Peribacteria bacterium RIFCSPLOWO2_12_FULL_55_15]|nr:MAG: hypothetical protein A2789_04025 [Candidatus Peribacteria bacterium RIFCSPHIGHO2_01_FULL_54_22]OGJ63246.1 MAG: hypothetical protein A3D12_02850 [Candidatus Peribacteria bacterium RIFCSPHIGHO2_02_FULL_55_24]OGJ65122.1 MAG: hypothetical protein A3E47_02215 [Candidatus Peribacteria bacterium RIFCSPHIGHO2_12_FULL_54_10]OGJ68154.1 MAG: hypothetical protein A2947_03845 [Candidatus Peribacteria bacterium RIFCSPLOWO2_01_FULL_54_110]OGJ70557.1 MAG: hypothetical protein A3H22_02640 [Candidatus Pe
MRFLHRLSAILFSIFGLTFALAYVLFRNEIAGVWPLWWLQVADLPLLLTGLIYGSISIERSLQQPSNHSRLISLIVFFLAFLLFAFFTFFNFWPLLSRQ